MDHTDAAVLAFATRRYRHHGARLIAVHDELDMTVWQYAAHLARLADDPQAQAAEPALIARLHRLRTARRAARTATSTSPPPPRRPPAPHPAASTPA